MNRRQKLQIIPAIILFFVTLLTACGEDVWGEIPSTITNFVTKYFPNTGISSYSEKGGNYFVQVQNSASLQFDTNYDWTVINGNGSPLPEVLIYDQLPQDAYNYLEETEQTSQVYELNRNEKTYTIKLYNSLLEYDITSHTIRSVSSQTE